LPHPGRLISLINCLFPHAFPRCVFLSLSCLNFFSRIVIDFDSFPPTDSSGKRLESETAKMEIRISSTTFSLLASLNLLLANVVMADHTCYDTWGNSDGEQSPCYSPGTTDLSGNTHCCKKGDICLSNGLCLTPGSNYIMTQQGCTDKAWGKGCNQYCDNKRMSKSGYLTKTTSYLNVPSRTNSVYQEHPKEPMPSL
jgi:hypothetical protein